MRKLTDHIVDGDSANHQLQIEVVDEPGQGGANHKYRISVLYPTGSMNVPLSNLEDVQVMEDGSICGQIAKVYFQNGPIKEFGVNGLTQEALLAIIIDRLRCFQAGPYSSEDNENALHYCQMALGDLQNRTKKRIARGVEGTHEK